MKASLLRKLQNLTERHQEIAALLSAPDITTKPKYFAELSKEYAQLEALSDCYLRYQNTLSAIEQAKLLLKDPDETLQNYAKDELQKANLEQEQLEQELQLLLLPQDPNDNRNLFLEIRAAAGGDEAAIFAGDLYRMYYRYAERQGWQVEIINTSLGEHGGYKLIVVRLVGQSVFAKLKFESGAHRVQRIPETEAQGRIHTSTCTVAILPEIDEVEAVKIDPADLKIDTYRASGAGGQHVNKTDSAIRITHLPSGVVIECQDERSQHKNRARAMSLLRAKLLAAEKEQQQTEQAQTRRNLVGTGDRSERIRTYNYPQGRLTDHRINLTLYKLTDILQGELDQVIEPLLREHQVDQLAALGE